MNGSGMGERSAWRSIFDAAAIHCNGAATYHSRRHPFSSCSLGDSGPVQTFLGAIVREYAAITLQEIGLRTAARSIRAGALMRSDDRRAYIPAAPAYSSASTQLGDAEPEVATVNPFIVETSAERQLQFAKHVLQSRMRLDDPYALVASYTRQMMSFLLFNPEPEHILMIGLGGGSLPKFCYLHLPHAQISVVEIDARVIAMRDSFCVPANDARFRVIHDDGARYVARLNHSIDVILIDAFDEAGVAPSLASSDFYADVWQRLDAGGVLVMNLLGSPRSYARHLDRVKKVFGSQVLLVTVTKNDNVLLFGFKPAVISPNAPQLSLRARYLQSRFKLHFGSYLQKLREGRTLE